MQSAQVAAKRRELCIRGQGDYRARSRLHRSQILQVNTRWKALAEIYTMHSFAPLLESICENWGLLVKLSSTLKKCPSSVSGLGLQRLVEPLLVES